MAKFVVGLRGGIGTGKSTVSDLFAERGVEIADADISARVVVRPGMPAHAAITAKFGETILLPSGELNRARLREIIFEDNAARRFVEKQTHGPIIEHLAETITNATSDYAILVLSTGTGASPMMQRLLVVDATVEQQIERVMARDNNSREQVMAIIDAQPSREVRVAEADDLIVNDGDTAHLKLEVERLHQLYSSLASTSGSQRTENGI